MRVYVCNSDVAVTRTEKSRRCRRPVTLLAVVRRHVHYAGCRPVPAVAMRDHGGGGEL